MVKEWRELEIYKHLNVCKEKKKKLQNKKIQSKIALKNLYFWMLKQIKKIENM